MRPSRSRAAGFTLIELLVVMAILGLLLAIVAPKYFHQVDRAREVALRSNLQLLRDAIDKHYADTGRYPDSLQRLVDGRYLRQVPIDPVTESPQTWLLLAPPDGQRTGVYEVKSGAPGLGLDGTPYEAW